MKEAPLIGSDRPGWHEYFMEIAKTVSLRSNCLRRQIGAVLVFDKKIISAGYNGTPRGTKNCFDGGCPRCAAATEATSGQSLGVCLCSHAEENAITQSAYHGAVVKNSTLYTMLTPCLICAKMIIGAGVTQVIYLDAYPSDRADGNVASEVLLGSAGIPICSLGEAMRREASHRNIL